MAHMVINTNKESDFLQKFLSENTFFKKKFSDNNKTYFFFKLLINVLFKAKLITTCKYYCFLSKLYKIAINDIFSVVQQKLILS